MKFSIFLLALLTIFSHFDSNCMELYQLGEPPKVIVKNDTDKDVLVFLFQLKNQTPRGIRLASPLEYTIGYINSLLSLKLRTFVRDIDLFTKIYDAHTQHPGTNLLVTVAPCITAGDYLPYNIHVAPKSER